MERHLQLLRRTLWLVSLPCLVPALWADSSPVRYIFDAEQSQMEVVVPRAGFLSVLGHDHTIAVRQLEGYFAMPAEDLGKAELYLEIPAASMVVVDEGVDDKTRAKIDREMRGEAVLDAVAHPLISFRASELVLRQPGSWLVKGLLSVSGVEKPVEFEVEVELSAGSTVRASGTASIKPERFGIKPVTVLGGAVRTARTIEVRFEVTGKAGDGEMLQ